MFNLQQQIPVLLKCCNVSTISNGNLLFAKTTINQLRKSHLLCSSPSKNVTHIQLSDAKTKNAFSEKMSTELSDKVMELENDATVRCIVISGDGNDLTSGINIKEFAGLHQQCIAIEDMARRAKFLKQRIEFYQRPFKLMAENVSKPIITCAHGVCIGIGLGLLASSDIRYCSRDTLLSIREVKLGFAPDVGHLQIIPELFNNKSGFYEYLFTGDNIPVEEAQQLGLIGRLFDTKQQTIDAAITLAEKIARNSPVAVQGSKINTRYCKNKSLTDGLDYNAVWNMSMMQTDEVAKSVIAAMTKEKIEYDNY